MSDDQRKINFQLARQAFLRGENVSENLRKQLGVAQNTLEIIELAYDLQAGDYIKRADQNPEYLQKFSNELAAVLNAHVKAGDTLLDAGTGEMTTLSAIANKIDAPMKRILAFDLSWSRLEHGRGFAQRTLRAELLSKLEYFAADISEIPLASGSIDIVMTVHALEPNGGREQDLIKELLRISRRRLILFEPSYELNSDEGKKRMDRMGYVKDLPGAIERLGAKLLDRIPLKTVANPLNPTVAYVVEASSKKADKDELFADPGCDSRLVRYPDCWFSPERGVAYPVIGGIPILRNNAAVLTSALAGR